MITYMSDCSNNFGECVGSFRTMVTMVFLVQLGESLDKNNSSKHGIT